MPEIVEPLLARHVLEDLVDVADHSMTVPSG
jgi:hypothetical protein